MRAPAFIPPCIRARAAEIWVDGRAIGWIGALHPRLVQAFDLPSAPMLFELDSQVLARRALPRHASLSRFPLVTARSGLCAGRPNPGGRVAGGVA